MQKKTNIFEKMVLHFLAPSSFRCVFVFDEVLALPPAAPPLTLKPKHWQTLNPKKSRLQKPKP